MKNDANKYADHDDYNKCMVCGGQNEILKEYVQEYWTMDCETKCKACGNEAYWSTGYYCREE